MDAFKCLSRTVQLAAILIATSTMFSGAARASEVLQVHFDLPSSIECRDVTTRQFAQMNPTLKLVEGRFRISARISDANPSGLVEFNYVLKTQPLMRITDYLPNNKLESRVDEDHIEVTDAVENANATGADAHVTFNPFTLGGSHNKSLKKSESSHYKQIAAKDLVLSSGTIDREHGVFFRLRPSRSESLEGGKEFRFLATVPRNWRGDLCMISCEAKASKKSIVSKSLVDVGTTHSQIGMYLAGDLQAAQLAEDLRVAQDTYAELAARQPSKTDVIQTISTHTVGMLNGRTAQQRQEFENAKQELAQVQEKIEQLAR